MNIVVLAGGNSTEREVSIASGQGICKALRERNHRAVMACLLYTSYGNGKKAAGGVQTTYRYEVLEDRNGSLLADWIAMTHYRLLGKRKGAWQRISSGLR